MSQVWLRYRGYRRRALRFTRARFHVSVDGAPPVTFKGGQVLLPVAPGRRHVRVWYQPAFYLAPTGWFDTLDREKSVGNAWIDVPVGGTVEVEYRPGWHLELAAELRVVRIHDASTWPAGPNGPVRG